MVWIDSEVGRLVSVRQFDSEGAVSVQVQLQHCNLSARLDHLPRTLLLLFRLSILSLPLIVSMSMSKSFPLS
jgi:hypothetical protein